MLFFLLLVVFVVEYTRPDDYLPFIIHLKLYSVLPISVFLMALVATTRNSNEQVLKSSIGKVLLMLLAIVTISSPLAINTEAAWELWRAMLGYLFLFFMVAKLCDDKEKIKWLFRVIVGIHAWLVLQNPALLTNPNQRTYVEGVTFLGDGNDFSLSAVIALPMCLYLYQSSRSSVERVLCVVAAIILFGAILGTQSRGAMLGVVAVALYLWIQTRTKGKGLVYIVLGLALVLAVASETYVSRMQGLAHYQEDGSAQARIIAWKAGIDMANRRLPLGVGPGCFPDAFGNWYSRPGLPRMNAHSIYFQALGEWGYAGFLLLLWLLWIMFRDNQSITKAIPVDSHPERLEYRRFIIAVTSSLVGFAVAGAFLSALYYPHLYVIAGVIFAARRAYLLDCPTEASPVRSEPANSLERRRAKAVSLLEPRRKR